jgi:ketosteroid isomerase-like protein
LAGAGAATAKRNKSGQREEDNAGAHCACVASVLERETMSQDNVQLVRRLLWDGVDAVPIVRDDAALATWLAEIGPLLAPECVFAWIAPGGRVEVKALDEEVRRVWLDFFEPWESLRFEIERVVAEREKVVVLTRLYGRMAGTENEVEALFAAVYLVRDGKVARAEFYSDRAEALEAAGLG